MLAQRLARQGHQARSANRGHRADRLVHEIADRLDLGAEPSCGTPERRRGDEFPEFAQLLESRFRRVPGDERRIDRSDRDAGHPIRIEMRIGQRLVDPRLISAESAAPLQQQGDAFEGRANGHPVRLPMRRICPSCMGGHRHDSSCCSLRIWAPALGEVRRGGRLALRIWAPALGEVRRGGRLALRGDRRDE